MGCKIVKHIKNNRYFLITILLVTLTSSSCKSKKILAASEAKSDLSAKAIIKNHYKNQLDFKTIRGKIKVDFDDGKKSQSFTLSLRMQKDETIWLSAPLSLVKVLITPTRVSFYNKLDDTYFDGDFSYLSNLLGTELNFEKVQNLLLGQAIFDLKKGKYFAAIASEKYQLKPKKDILLFKKLFLLAPTHFKMTLQQLSQPKEDKVLAIHYKTYQKVDGKIFPDEIRVTASQNTSNITIELDYKNIKFNQKVSFPYQIPKGYKQVTIK